jgi:hypothetical protein
MLASRRHDELHLHTSANVSKRQHTSACVSMRAQHTSAYALASRRRTELHTVSARASIARIRAACEFAPRM